MGILRRILLVGCLAGLALPAGHVAEAAVPAPGFSIMELGPLPGGTSDARAIDNAGVVVGDSALSGSPRAVEWDTSGTLHVLGSLPGSGYSVANAINDVGQVAGVSDRFDGGYGYPVRWSATGAIADLGGPVTNRLGEATAINSAGRVAGGQRPADSEGSPLGILYSSTGVPTELGPDLGLARGINGYDQVVGGSPGYLWQHGSVTLLPGLPGGAGSASATAINNSGQIVGTAAAQGFSSHAVLWSDGRVQDLGTVDGAQFSTATAINAAGQVVGTADPMCSPCAPARAWMWSPGGVITALDSLLPAGSGWSLRTANGINDRGEIVGSGLFNGVLRAYKISPAFHVNINFQPEGARIPAGYLADTGAAFGPRSGGLSYGWASDSRMNARERNAPSAPDQRYDTFIHLQKPRGARHWDLAVANGNYLVHVVAGDPDNIDSHFRIVVEGQVAASGTPTAARHWFESTVRVAVRDGRLTISNGTGSSNDKIDYIDVVAM